MASGALLRGAAHPLTDISVNLQNLRALPLGTPDTKQLRAKIERIVFVAPGTVAVTEPEILHENFPLPIAAGAGGAATISALTLNPHDVLRITISKP